MVDKKSRKTMRLADRTAMNKEEIKDMEKFIKQLPKQKIEEYNKKAIEETKKQHSEFRTKFAEGNCSGCNKALASFDEKLPCLHWLLMPKGFKKKHFELIIKKFSYVNMDSYLRWVANQETLFGNINDLDEERRDSMMFEYTIKYKNYEWVFSCGKNDFEGHPRRQHGKYPHYHFQMRINNLPFINFTDFHIPLSHHDTYAIRAKRKEIEGVAHSDGYGSGMGALFESENHKEILKQAKTTENFDKATIHTSYIIEAEQGKKISGDELAKLFQESKKTGAPLHNLLHKLKNVKRSAAIVSPGDGVPKIFKRGEKSKKTLKAK